MINLKELAPLEQILKDAGAVMVATFIVAFSAELAHGRMNLVQDAVVALVTALGTVLVKGANPKDTSYGVGSKSP